MAGQQYDNNRRPYQGHQNQGEPDYPLSQKEKEIKAWVKSGLVKESVEFAHDFGKFIAEKSLTNSQIRIAFGELRRIQMNGYQSCKTDFLLLKPKMAYAVKRHKGKGIESFYNFFSYCSDAVIASNSLEEQDKSFKNLIQLMEAVLAYHKFHGGKEN